MKMKKLYQLVLVLVTLSLLISGCVPQGQQQQSTINYVQTNAANMMAQLKTGEIDGFIAWEPVNAQAISEGTGRYLEQSGTFAPNHPCCVLALAGTEGDDDLALALAWANVKAVNFINDPANQEKLIQYGMDFSGKDREAVLEGISHIKYVSFPDRQQFEAFYSGLRENGSLIKDAQSLGYQDDHAFFQDFLASKYFDQVNAELAKNPDWIPPAVSSSRQVNLGYVNQDIHQIQAHIAVQEGYYSKVGLVQGRNLQIKGYANGVAVMEAFKVKELTAAYLGGAPAVLKRMNDGITIRVIAGANNEGSAIVVAKNSSIQSVADLAGKTIAIPGLGTVQGYILDLVARQNNMKLQAK